MPAPAVGTGVGAGLSEVGMGTTVLEPEGMGATVLVPEWVAEGVHSLPVLVTEVTMVVAPVSVAGALVPASEVEAAEVGAADVGAAEVPAGGGLAQSFSTAGRTSPMIC